MCAPPHRPSNLDIAFRGTTRRGGRSITSGRLAPTSWAHTRRRGACWGHEQPPGLARASLPSRRHLRRGGHQLLDLLGGGRGGRAVPVRRPHRGADRALGAHRALLPRLPAGRPTRPALRLPGPCSVGHDTGNPRKPGQAPARPLRQGHRRDDDMAPVALLPPPGRPDQARDDRRCALHAAFGRRRPVLRLGRRPPAGHRPERHRHLRGPRQGGDVPAPRDRGGAARHLQRPRPPGLPRAPGAAAGDGHRAHARSPVRPRPPAGGGRSTQLLGLQLDRLPGAA